MVNGKSKGSGFEREVAKKLSLWYSNSSRDDLFWRSHNSGGRFTILRKKNKILKGQEGDICSTDPLSDSFINMYYIEIKSYKDLNIWSLFTEKGILFEFINTYFDKATESKKVLLLICKQNNKPTLLITNSEIITKYNMLYSIKDVDLKILKFDDFLKLDSKLFGWEGI